MGKRRPFMSPPPPSPGEAWAWVRTRWQRLREDAFSYAYRHVWYIFAAQFVFLLSGCLGFWVPRNAWEHVQWIRLGLPLCLMGVVVVYSFRRSRSIKLAEYKVCFRCGYELRGLDASGNCPECGRAYEFAALARKWKGEG